MWIRVATNQDSIKVGQAGNFYVDGPSVEEFYFDDSIVLALDQDNFLPEMWDKLEAMFDWGDCDYFDAKRCLKLHLWVTERLRKCTPPVIQPVYEAIDRFTLIAIEKNTGIYFDF